MFGQNPVAKKDEGSGLALHVVAGSPFYTIQGEGPFAGEPAVFLRLHGCPLRCFFCDTQFSDPGDPVIDVDIIVDQAVRLFPSWCLDIDKPEPLVVITGGEPTRQNLTPLIQRLLLKGFRVQIETAGLFWQTCMGWDNVTVVVSPKTPEIDTMVFNKARAFKYVIQADAVAPEDGLPNMSTQRDGKTAWLQRPRGGAEVFLSPMDEGDSAKNQRNAMAVAQIAMKFGYRAGLQLHKFMAVP